MSDILPVTLDGITTIPRGTIGTIKTYLIRDLDAVPPSPTLDVALVRLKGSDAARYRTLFTTLGTRWLWWSRLLLPPDALAGLLDDPKVEAHAIVRDGVDIGLFELDFRENPADLAFLGLYDTATGQGLGRQILHHALARAAQKGARQITVNTCTFDHPAALAFYRSFGFSVIRQAVELVPDPRLSGLLPRHAAPHIPLLP